LARDTSFYYSFLVLPADKRRAIVAVWDFCRAVDDAVDEAPAEQSASEVQRWRDEVARCFDGATPETSQGRALQPLIAGFDLPRSAFEALVEGVEMDLHGRRYRTFDELYEYCIRVASAVGLMCVRIFGCIGSGVAPCDRSGRRAAAHEHPPRRPRRSRARARIPADRRSRALRVTETDLRDETAHAGVSGRRR
jgi:phytoene/squalene synthetase